MEENKKKPVIGITIGDFNGIGMEVIIKSLHDTRILKQFIPVIYGSGGIIAYYIKLLNINDFIYQQTHETQRINPKRINIINVWNEKVIITPGMPATEGGKYAIKSLKKAVEDLKLGKIDALATAPIHKEHIRSDIFSFNDHTEYLTHEGEVTDSLMLMVHENLRIGVVTGHMALNQVSKAITKEKVISKLNILHKTLKRDFGISKPKIAVLGLNPHVGENGLFGTEDNDEILPAIREVKNKGHIVVGPFPADSFFGTASFERFDGILAMYHDQGLIPFKVLAFDQGVNYTAGLPFVRTSPVHGTAFSLAGKNRSNSSSFRNALFLASKIVQKRNEYTGVK